jgi:uncharacterized protein YutE (UPF0331/DUF86 family)
MDRDLIETKLESLRRCLERLEQKTPRDAATLHQDLDLQDIIVVNLERAVQVCVDIATHTLASRKETIPPTMAACFTQMSKLNIIDADLAGRLVKSVGFRNIAVHAYDELDFDVVFSILNKHLVDFKNFATAIVNQLD